MSSDVNDPRPATPVSPPPSFHSRASSPTSRRLLSSHDPLISDAERALADSFDSPSDDEDPYGGDERRIQGSQSSAQTGDASTEQNDTRRGLERRVTELPVFTPAVSTGSRAITRPTHDGVFTNLSAKPERGEKTEDQPPVGVLMRVVNLLTESMLSSLLELRTSRRGCYSSILGNHHSRSWNWLR